MKAKRSSYLFGMLFVLCLCMNIAQAGGPPGAVPLKERMLDPDEYGACTGKKTSLDSSVRTIKVTWVYTKSDQRLIANIQELGSGQEATPIVGATRKKNQGDGTMISWTENGKNNYVQKGSKNGDMSQNCKGTMDIQSLIFWDDKAYCLVADSAEKLQQMETETCSKSCVEGMKSCCPSPSSGSCGSCCCCCCY
jgi:hypothetical protein